MDTIKANTDIIDTITDNIPFVGMLGTGRVNAYKPMLAPPCMLVGEVEKERQSSELIVYPNPANDRVNFNIYIQQEGMITVRLLNYLGQDIYSEQRTNLIPGENRLSLSLNGISNGTYFVQVLGDEFSYSRKLIIAGK